MEFVTICTSTYAPLSFFLKQGGFVRVHDEFSSNSALLGKSTA